MILSKSQIFARIWLSVHWFDISRSYHNNSLPFAVGHFSEGTTNRCQLVAEFVRSQPKELNTAPPSVCLGSSDQKNGKHLCLTDKTNYRAVYRVLQAKYPSLLQPDLNSRLFKHDPRVNGAWFLWTAVNYYQSKGKLAETDIKCEYLDGGRHSNTQDLCRLIWEDIFVSKNKWVTHTCKTPGCSVRYVTVDGKNIWIDKSAHF